MDKSKAKLISNDIQNAIKEVLNKHNIKLNNVNGSFSDEKLNLKLEIIDMNEEVQEEAENNLVNKAKLYFNINKIESEKYKMIDINMRAHKMPIVYLNKIDGKRYKCSSDRFNYLIEQ